MWELFFFYFGLFLEPDGLPRGFATLVSGSFVSPFVPFVDGPFTDRGRSLDLDLSALGDAILY